MLPTPTLDMLVFVNWVFEYNCFFAIFMFSLLEAGFNKTVAHCSDPTEEYFVNVYSDWPALNKDGSDGYCFDASGRLFMWSLLKLTNFTAGVGYQLGQSFLTCSGCMEFICKSLPCQDRDGSLSKMFWELERVMPECCQTCDGSVVPPNKVVSSTHQGGECQVREVAICKTVLRGTGT